MSIKRAFSSADTVVPHSQKTHSSPLAEATVDKDLSVHTNKRRCRRRRPTLRLSNDCLRKCMSYLDRLIDLPIISLTASHWYTMCNELCDTDNRLHVDCSASTRLCVQCTSSPNAMAAAPRIAFFVADAAHTTANLGGLVKWLTKNMHKSILAEMSWTKLRIGVPSTACVACAKYSDDDHRATLACIDHQTGTLSDIIARSNGSLAHARAILRMPVALHTLIELMNSAASRHSRLQTLVSCGLVEYDTLLEACCQKDNLRLMTWMLHVHPATDDIIRRVVNLTPMKYAQTCAQHGSHRMMHFLYQRMPVVINAATLIEAGITAGSAPTLHVIHTHTPNQQAQTMWLSPSVAMKLVSARVPECVIKWMRRMSLVPNMSAIFYASCYTDDTRLLTAFEKHLRDSHININHVLLMQSTSVLRWLAQSSLGLTDRGRLTSDAIVRCINFVSYSGSSCAANFWSYTMKLWKQLHPSGNIQTHVWDRVLPHLVNDYDDIRRASLIA